MYEILKLVIPVLLGGVLTLGSVYLSPWLHDRAEKKQRRSQKFEELVAALYEHQHWLNTLKNVTAFGEKETLGVSPISKVRAIAVVYFPSLNDAILKLNNAAGHYQLSIYQAAQRRLAGDISTMTEPMLSAYGPYIDEFNKLMVNLDDFAEREFR